MDEDYTIIENELIHQLAYLKRDLHMKKVKTLDRKLQGLKKMALQRKLRRSMTLQVEELEFTVSKIYSPQNAVKDNEIKFYLIYLLQLKDFFQREVQTKKEIIQQREDQIKKLTVKLCLMRNEYSKRKRRVRSNPSEITQLENMSNKMNKLEQRVCSLKSDMKGQRESIMDMRVFQKQYKNLENKFRSQITRMAEDVQHHLDTAVTTYEQREEFINKAKIYKERCAQDLRKAALNENALQLVLDESEKLEEFENIQKQKRFDSRIATTGELIDQGLTGLESELKRNKHLNSAILHSSGKEDTEVVEGHYKLTDEHSKSMFSYLEQLLKYIRHLQVTINELKDESGKTQNSLVTQERRLKWETAVEKKLAEELEQEVTSSESSVQDAREQLHFLLKKLQSLHNKMGFPQEAEEPEDAAGSDAAEKDAEEHEISESNAIDFKEGIEKDVLKLLMVIEYLRVKELTEDSEEEVSTTSVLGDTADDELQEGVEVSEVEYVNAAVQPRVLKSTSGMDIFLELDDTDRFLDLDELKEKAGMAVTELEKEGRVESKE